ncbi:MBL fold metallo-hydrolase [Neobacillus ginsengisoli]|uniref:Glyoxylase-like metal-dependent hydrolase (Beta-lactamase superfamily II) n=1 Tax=Neobacillus ginsengisoli TaxID=904295 RepID=A0ABT9XXX5_9BACI|nr:MBL fold metallo-hydrolase [Neobacillus ginsengisoli]MDQ0200349.1 glyoxylase-like metal-dependent hydrolase (beta-lactamase superfamily II) [Neobacillus ginsengisoli]
MIHIFKKEGVTCVEGKVEKFGRSVYTFLVDGMIIDTGPQCLEAELIPFYKEHSFDLVGLTHSHEDHSGTASWIQENLNVPIYVHPKGIGICAQPCSYPEYRQLTWGVRKEFLTMPLGETIQSRSQEWKVIYTPGHAEDHISLFHEETGRLFSGDLFVAPKTKVIMDGESIPVTMDSIRKLLSYDFESLFCSHAGYIQDGKRMMGQKLEHLENLCGEVEHLHKEGLSVVEIDKKLFPKKYPIVAFSEGEWDSLHIVTSIVSDIEKMRVI